MKKMLSLHACLLLFGQSFAQGTEIQSVREFFVQAGNNREKAGDLYRSISMADAARNPVLKAYKGSARAMMAENYFSPFEKYSCFSEGRKLLDESIAQNPDVAETRFLRFIIQLNTPAFLGYDNMEEDFSILFKAFSNQNNFQHDLFYYSMVNMLLDSGRLDQKKVDILKQFKLKKQNK